MKGARGLSRLALLSATLAATGCGNGCGSKASGSDAGANLAEAQTPIPAPAGHLGDLYMAAPGATWAKARGTIGGVALFLPQNFGAVVATLVGFPVTLSAEIDDAVPAVGAAAKVGTGPVQVVVAVHVKSGERFLDQLTRGESARYNPALDAQSHVTLLTDKVPTGAASKRAALGLLGNYLVIAAKPADLFALAPYVVRTVAVAKPPADDVVLDVPEKALAGAVLDQVREAQKAVAGASISFLPFNGMMDTATTLLGDASGGRCTVNLDASAVHARCGLTPKPGGAGAKLAADLATGDTKPLLDLPDSTNVGILWRETLAQRSESAPKQADALAQLLGPNTSADDKAAISAALTAEAAARGDWQAIGVAFNGTGPTGVARVPVSTGSPAGVPATDPEAMKKALKQLVDLTQLASFKKALGTLGLTVAIEKAVVENLAADVTRLRLVRAASMGDPERLPHTPPVAKKDAGKGPQTSPNPNEIDLLYYVDAGGLFGAAGFDPKDGLRALSKSAAGGNLGASAPFASLITPLGSEPFFVLVADLLRVEAMTKGTMPAATPTPLLVAAGRSATDVWSRLDVPNPVLQELVQQYIRRKPGL